MPFYTCFLKMIEQSTWVEPMPGGVPLLFARDDDVPPEPSPEMPMTREKFIEYYGYDPEQSANSSRKATATDIEAYTGLTLDEFTRYAHPERTVVVDPGRKSLPFDKIVFPVIRQVFPGRISDEHSPASKPDDRHLTFRRLMEKNL